MAKIEVISRTERRRQYSVAEKEVILAALEQPGVGVTAVARRFGVAKSLIYNWRSARRAAADQVDSLIPLAKTGFAPVILTESATVPEPSSFSAMPPTLRSNTPPPLCASAPGSLTAQHIDLHFPDGLWLRVSKDVASSRVRELLQAVRCGA